MRVEANMMLMRPLKDGKPNASKLHQLDIETGKIVTELKFGKDGLEPRGEGGSDNIKLLK